MHDLIPQFLRYCSLEENLTPATVKGIKGALWTFVRRTGIQNMSEITVDVLRNFFYEGREQHHWSTSNFLNYRKYLKKFFDWCVRREYCKINPVLDIKKPKLEKTLPRVLTKTQAQSILCASLTHNWFYSFERYRNYAIIATMLFTGIRANELLNLKITDVNLVSERIFIHAGKGRKDRYVPVHRTLRVILESYIKERQRWHKTSEYFFTGAQSNEPLAYKHLSTVCKKISQSTGFKFTPHTLRHTCATEMLNQKLDIFKVSTILGHNDIKTTAIYLHTATESLQQSLNALDLYV